MKQPILLFSTAVLSLAACREPTTPEPRHAEIPLVKAARLTVAEDSSLVWSAAALDDAASRLVAGLPDERARRSLTEALLALASRLRAIPGDAPRSELIDLHDSARHALSLLEDQGLSGAADRDGITLALDHAHRLIGASRRAVPDPHPR
jgi:hypothetical protein